MNLIVNETNYGLIKEEDITINLCKNGLAIMIFWYTAHKMKASQ